MFEVSLFDHLRLTFGHIVYRHKAHAQTARSHLRWSRVIRGAEGLLMLGVVITSVAAAAGRGRGYIVASAVLGGLSLATLLVQLTFDIDASARAHASCAARLWAMRERYRAVLSDLYDGAIDAAIARQRRDYLAEELHELFQHGPPADPQAYQPAGQVTTADEPALPDEQIDQYLPKSLHKVERPATT